MKQKFGAGGFRFQHFCSSCGYDYVEEEDWCKKHQMCFHCGSQEGCCGQWTCGMKEMEFREEYE